MKTYNNLFEKIVSIDNIIAAIHEAARGKRRKKSVQYALAHTEEKAKEIQKLLASRTWIPKPIHDARVINDGITAKQRVIVCPEFCREQIVHHAIMRVCAPLFVRKFYLYSCGSIPGRGREFAIKYISERLHERKKSKYFTVLDIRKCYDNIKPDVALAEIKRTIADKDVLELFEKILANNEMRMADGSIVRKGLLMGMFTSPWIANIVLNPLDHLLKDGCGMNTIVRYMDDIIILHSNKRQIRKAIAETERWLAERGMELKTAPAIHKVTDVKINYIGFTLTAEKTVLSSRAFLKARRVVKRVTDKPRLNGHDARRIVSYAGLFKRADTRRAFACYFKRVNVRRCRLLISKTERKHNNVVEKSRKQHKASASTGDKKQ